MQPARRPRGLRDNSCRRLKRQNSFAANKAQSRSSCGIKNRILKNIHVHAGGYAVAQHFGMAKQARKARDVWLQPRLDWKNARCEASP